MNDAVAELIELADGRTLEVVRLGSSDSPALVFHHGTPGAWSTALLLADVAEEAGMTVYAYSRAGYGRSSAHVGRSVASVVEDVKALRGHYGVEDYVSVGWSGGGPHALACAALDPRCLGAISLAGVAPYSADFDWTAGMGPENIEEFAAAREGGEEFEAALNEAGESLCDISANGVVVALGGLVGAPDVSILNEPHVSEALARSLRDAFVVSARGMIDDDYAFVADWGFAPHEITRSVEVWFGDEDLMVPSSHGHWLGATIPGAVLRHFPDDGHISLVTSHREELVRALTTFVS